jgi:hypothetical protein
MSPLWALVYPPPRVVVSIRSYFLHCTIAAMIIVLWISIVIIIRMLSRKLLLIFVPKWIMPVSPDCFRSKHKGPAELASCLRSICCNSACDSLYETVLSL